MPGGRFTKCEECGKSYITLVEPSCPSCSPAAPAATPAPSSPDSAAVLINPGGNFSSGVLIQPHFSIVFPILQGQWPWCPEGLGVVNLTVPTSDGPVLAAGRSARPTPVEFFDPLYHRARSSRCTVAPGIYKELVCRYPAVVEVEEAQPLFAPAHKVALRVHVEPGCSPPFTIELCFAGQGSHDLDLRPSRTELWRATGRVLSSRAPLWSVRFHGALPSALDAALMPRQLFPGP